MKKIYTLCLSAFLGMSAFAQTQPERIVIHEKSGNFKGFLAERVDSITFPKLEGRVAADVEIKSVALDSAIISITRSEQCRAFKLLVIPEVTANRLPDDGAMAGYVDGMTQDLYYQDFENGILNGANFDADTKYVLVTVGYDMYGIACGVVRAPFATPKRPLVGDVKMQTVVDEVLAREFTCSFYPSADVEGYAVVAGKAGTMQAQYEQWGPMMGFKNFGDLVKGWGIQGGKDEIGHTWKNMDPNTDYDVFVQAWDVNGTYADCDTVKVRTKMLGGEGVADVAVTLGAYKMTEWDGQKLPSQFIDYTPNDQTGSYRFSVATAAEFDKDPESFKNELPQEPPFPDMANWFFYEPISTDYQINPNTEFVVLTAARNGVGVWSQVKVERFTTPAQVEGETPAPAPAVAQTKIAKRAIKSHTIYMQPGQFPNFYQGKKEMKLTLK